MAYKIGIIGFGNMGSAIAQQLKAKYSIIVFDSDKNKTKDIRGMEVAKDIVTLTQESDSLILAVKPQDFDAVLKAIKKFVVKEKLIISIAAGISTAYIENVLGEVGVVRVMPNMGAKIGESVSCLAKGRFAGSDDLDFAKEVFYYLGVVKIIDEKMMNAATAISGSGPAYIFNFIEENSLNPDDISEHTKHDLMRRLERAAEILGFNLEDAAFLSANTTNTSLSLIKTTKLPAAELIKQVASKGGTTEAALVVLRKGGSWEEAARAAEKRAGELAKG